MDGAVMDLSALKTFQAVAETASVTRAADKLCCVPSAVTARLRQLEQEIGQPLFLRERQGMILTPKGRVLLDYAKKAMVLFDEAEKAVRHDDLPQGTLKVGATDTAATLYLPRVFAQYHLSYPDVSLEVTSGVTETLIAGVRDHKLDCAIVNREVRDPLFKAEQVRRERLVLVSALTVDQITDADEFTFLAAPTGCVQRARVEEWWSEGAHAPIRLIEMANIEMRISCAAAGMGVTVLPLSTLERLADRETVRIHDVPEPWAWLDTFLISRADSPSFAARRLFREMVLQEFRQLRAVV
jgi:DNA-binding transcriptional LysR family regulator